MEREQYRDELRLFAYLMSGSLGESESMTDQVLDAEAGESCSGETDIRVLLHARAVATCLERLASRPRRSLPSLRQPHSDPALPPEPGSETDAWVEPFPDDFFPDALKAPDPPREYSARECISLYMSAALQDIDPRARAAFILCDLFGWPASLARAALTTEAPELQPALDDAREIIKRSYLRDLGRRLPPPDSVATALSMRYLHPWEAADLESLMARLTTDVVFQSPPSPSWYRGAGAFRRFAGEHLLPDGSRGHWRLLPIRASGQLGFGAYRLDKSRRLYLAHSIHVLYFDEDLITEIVCITDADLFPLFGLLPEVVVQGSI